MTRTRTPEDRREERQQRRAAGHRIVEVRFAQTAAQGRPSSEAPVLCTCGEVVRSAEWDQHRGARFRADDGLWAVA